VNTRISVLRIIFLIEELVDEFTKKCHVCEFLPFVENKVHMKSHVCKGSNPDEDRFLEQS